MEIYVLISDNDDKIRLSYHKATDVAGEEEIGRITDLLKEALKRVHLSLSWENPNLERKTEKK